MPENDPEGLIEHLINDPQAYVDYVYTPAEEAVIELRKRAADSDLDNTVNHLPPLAHGGNKAIYSVCTATPNYVVRRFMSIADALNLEPLIFERKGDKYVPQNNEFKHSLGKLHFNKGTRADNQAILSSINIIDFSTAPGKKIDEIQTTWGQPLQEFHHELLLSVFPSLDPKTHLFDNSEWFHEVGGTARAYYDALLSIALRHGILFDNFLLNESELAFTRDIFLPAFIKVYKDSGLKPLVVALEPTELEGSKFWIAHPPETEETVLHKLKK